MSPLAMFLAAIEEINMAVVSDLKRVKFDRNSDLKSPGGVRSPGRSRGRSELKSPGGVRSSEPTRDCLCDLRASLSDARARSWVNTSSFPKPYWILEGESPTGKGEYPAVSYHDDGRGRGRHRQQQPTVQTGNLNHPYNPSKGHLAPASTRTRIV